MATAHSSLHLSLGAPVGRQRVFGAGVIDTQHSAVGAETEIRAKARVVEFQVLPWGHSTLCGLGAAICINHSGSSFPNYEKNFYLNPKTCCHLAMAALATIWGEESRVTHCSEGRVTASADTCLCRLVRIESEGKKLGQTCWPLPDFGWYAKLARGYCKQRDKEL